MKLGFIYAGQGSQRVGMGKDFYDEYPLFRETLELAGKVVPKVTPMDVKMLSFEGPIETLSQTKYTQPCMVAYAVGITKLLFQEQIRPDYVCGLSLGEYSALYAAGVLSEEDVLSLVAFRGKVMEEAVLGREVKMSAVLMMDRKTVLDCCEQATRQLAGETVVIDGKVSREAYLVQAANFNCPGQIVISGDAKAVDLATELLREQGGKRILPLAVSGPFHTALMKPAGDRLKDRFSQVSFGEEMIPVVMNATGKPKSETENYPALLEKQVQSSVYLEDSIRYMEQQGVDTIVEIGPGNTISKFVKKTAPGIKVYSIDSVENLQQTIKDMK